ncbi:MAG: universal stress protein [Vicinamibacterales bacterium]
MTARLLCPIDFSEVSTHALEQAAALARRRGDRVWALAVLPSLAPLEEPPAAVAATVASGGADDLRRWRARAEAQCRAVAAAGVDLTLDVREGHPVEAILDRAAALDATAIVMGTHGASGVRRFLLGSVTEQVVRRATVPVLVVPPRAEGTAAARFERVLAAVDFSPCSAAAVAAAAALARDGAGRLTVLHVVEWPWHDDPTVALAGIPPPQADALQQYRRYLEHGAAERLQQLVAGLPEGVEVATAVRFGRPYVEILGAAADGADLVALGVRGRSAFDLGFFGSTTNHVVRAATCPVLTVHA